MMVRRVETRSCAPPLRFLILCVGGWIVVRIMMVWNPALPSPPGDVAPWSAPSPFVAGDAGPDRSPSLVDRQKGAPTQKPAGSSPAFAAASAPLPGVPSDTVGARVGAHALGADRHSVRLALMARLLPSRPGGVVRSAVATGGALWFPLAPAAQAEPGQGRPFWIRQPLSGWSLGGWLYLREGTARAPDPLGAAGQLGGSQAGLRLGYGFGGAGRARAYGRATIAVQRPQQREIALGLAFAPLAQLPLDLAIEQRFAVGKEGRTALAMVASGGVSDVMLPAGFRLDAYGQAGVVGSKRRDGFADGAVVIDHRIGADDTSPVRFGGLAAGAVQPGAARIDVGPRLTLRLPHVGEGSRIALDWRQRVAGDARPESGLALTLASDF